MGSTADSASSWRRLWKEQARPRSISGRSDAHWFVVATVCFGAFMGQLDASIVTLAFPTLSDDFHRTQGAVQWVGLTYLLVLAVALPMVGRLADMVGRKLLYMYGFVIFIIGSALCGLAPGLLALDGFRILQALGAAMLQANSVAIIVNAMPPDQIGRGVGVQGVAQALGLALGPVAGGLLIAVGGWRWIFFVNVPVGIAGTVLARYFIPRSRNLAARARFDWGGFATLVPAVGLLFLALSLGNILRWGSSVILGWFGGAAVCFGAFVWWERRAVAPLVHLALLRIRHFSVGIGSALLMYVALFGALYITPFLLEKGLHYGPGRTGLVNLALPAALGLVAPFAGRWADRWGPRPLVLGGMTLAGAAMAGLAAFGSHPALLVALLALAGAGLGASVSPNNAATVGAAPRENSGLASGVLNMSRGLGTAMGLSLSGLIYGGIAPFGSAPPLVVRGYGAAMVFLAAVALATALLTLLMEPRASTADPQFTLE